MKFVKFDSGLFVLVQESKERYYYFAVFYVECRMIIIWQSSIPAVPTGLMKKPLIINIGKQNDDKTNLWSSLSLMAGKALFLNVSSENSILEEKTPTMRHLQDSNFLSVMREISLL